LRATVPGVPYRVLYFFHGNTAVVISHGLAKEKEVPSRQIDIAVWRKAEFERNPKERSYEENVG
jgi:phage-related protein